MRFATKFAEEFKKFATRGNVVDMGIGIVVGAAFTTVVNSFVQDILNPPLGLLTGEIDFSEKVIVLKKATEEAAAVAINYGLFINALINFLLVALAVFIVVKQMNRMREKQPLPELTEKMCPHCCSNIPVKANKCKFCTTVLI